MKIDTKSKQGRLNQSATILSNDPLNPKTQISIGGSIKQFISVEPSTRIELQGYYGDKVKQQVTITSLTEKLFRITDITSDIEDKIKYKLKGIKKGEKYSLEIMTRSGIKESFQGKMVLKTNSEKKPAIEIYVFGKLNKEVRIAPEFLYFGIIDSSIEVIDPMSLKRTVMVSGTREGKGNLSFKEIQAKPDWVTTEVETLKEGENYNIVIMLDKDALPKGQFREKVTILTEYNKRPQTATIIIEGKVI